MANKHLSSYAYIVDFEWRCIVVGRGTKIFRGPKKLVCLSLAALFQLSAYYNNGEERIKIRERWLSKAEANVDLRKVQKGI